MAKRKRKRKAKTLPNMGRPTDYRSEEHPAAIRLLARKWMSQHEIAEALGIGHTTLVNWLRDHPDFRVSYDLGREEASDRVERALIDRACGFKQTVKRAISVSDGLNKGSHVETVEIEESLPPDPSSIKFWLTNRRPKGWIEKTTVLHLDDRATRIAKARARVAKPKETT